MYPVIIANGRSLQSETVLDGYRVPKGVICLIIRFLLPQTIL